MRNTLYKLEWNLKPKIYTSNEHIIKRSDIDKDAIFVVETLRRAGHKAYLVGGCVRDLLLGHTPKDYDISTSALPEQIKPLFSHCLLIGRRFRLAHVRIGKKVIEVATFRQGDPEDESLIVSDNLWGSEEEDVMRRDFTINGLFYDPIEEVIIDYVDGMLDAKKCALRSIGNSFIRFKQDPVRMIRLLKFRARFGLNVDQEAIEALLECRMEILKSSKARILEELLRMLESGASYPFIKLLANHGILEILLPAISSFLEKTEGGEIYSFLQEIDQILITKQKRYLPRAILLSAIIFPLLQRHIHLLHENRTKPMHLGEIQDAVHLIIHEAFAPFLFITRKLSGELVSILTSQYRFTPIEKKKRFPLRIPRLPDFHLSLEFFELRTRIEPGLQQIFEEWQYYYKKHQKRKTVPS